jgi:non-heme chloroperoxidase
MIMKKAIRFFFVGMILLAVSLVNGQDTAVTNDNAKFMYGSPAGKYVKVSSDLNVYYLEEGSGTPFVIIPGWTAASEHFVKQIAYFSDRYRVISYDPRSQGDSSKTFENNNYTQHGEDLKAFMDALELKDVILMGHSAGCTDAYAYFQTYGTDNVKAFICIDSTFKATSEKEGEWGDPFTFEGTKGFYNILIYNRKEWIRPFLESMLVNPVPEEVNWFYGQLIKTPDPVALQLIADITIADYTEEAKMIADKIAVLNVVAEAPGWSDEAEAWFKNNAPKTEVVIMPGVKHFLFWEFADEFHAILDEFLAKVE